MRGAGVVAVGAAALEIAELAGKVPGLHAMAAPSEVGSGGLQLGRDELEVMLEVTNLGLLFAVSYDLSVCCPVG